MSKFELFGHFLQNCSLKVSNILHDGSRQQGALLEDGAIFRKNLNSGLTRGLIRD